MTTNALHTVEPSAEILAATRAYLDPIRRAMGDDFLAAYLTGSVLTQGFDPKRSRINLLLVSRVLDGTWLEAVRTAIPEARKPPRFDPLFVSERQIEKSLDVFPMEWLDVKERHLRLEGSDVFAALEVPETYLRLQCEHELRGKHIRLRQAYLLSRGNAADLAAALRDTASGFATLFRALLRLRGETPPAETGHVIGRVAEVYELNAQHLLGQHLVRYSGRRYKPDEMELIYRRFLAEVDKLVIAIDQLQVR
jgi:hypothetical protein